MGGADSGVRDGVSKSNGSSGSQTGSGYSTDVSDDNLPNDAQSPASEPNNNSDSDEQVLICCCSCIVNGHLSPYVLFGSLFLMLFFTHGYLCRMREWSQMI